MNLTTIDLIEKKAVFEAERSFHAFRQYINRGAKRPMKLGWFQRMMSSALQTFYDDLIAGKKPKLVIQAPPQHGKSVLIIDFIAWFCGKHPEMRTIYTSFSDRLGVRANLRLQRIMESPRYKKVFPNTNLNGGGPGNKDTSLRNREILEFTGQEGYFRNTTVCGSITGESLDLGVIDDPIKGREAANSLTIRDKTWDWFTDDFFTRFSEDAGLLCILTRWHPDDPIGRLIATIPGVKVLSFPAIATADAKLMPEDPRTPGGSEALFPELKSAEFILERKAALGTANFSALYQQNPIMLGGDLIRGEWFRRYTTLPPIKYRIMFADTAQKTKEHNDYSVFEVWGLGEDAKLYLLDMMRGKWEAPELRRRAVGFWAKHKAMEGIGPLRQLIVEDKSSGTGLIQELKVASEDGTVIPIKGIERTIDKLTRVMDVVSYIEAGHVFIPLAAAYVSDFISECEMFTADDSHQHDDQIDPMCDAINTMLAKKKKGFFDVA